MSKKPEGQFENCEKQDKARDKRDPDTSPYPQRDYGDEDTGPTAT